MDWNRRLRRELERIRSIESIVRKYLKLDLANLGYVRRCYRWEELRPFKLRKSCVPLKNQSYCIDFDRKRIFVTFVDTDYRCYVITFTKEGVFRQFVERLCKLRSNSCRIYSFCSCS